MDIVREMAIEFAEYKYERSENVNDFIEKLESEIYRLNSNSDKLNFISTIENFIKSKYDEHFKTCQNKDKCEQLKEHGKALYFIKGLLKNNGMKIENADSFSEYEKSEYDEKLNLIINDLSELKKGNEIIYDDLFQEIENLKSLYFIGKKNWKQLLAGKTIEMVAGGVISESISKELIKLTGIITSNLLR